MLTFIILIKETYDIQDNVLCLQLGISSPFINIHEYFSVVAECSLDEAITQHLKMMKECLLRLNPCLSKTVLWSLGLLAVLALSTV